MVDKQTRTMSFLSHKVQRSEIKPADHIYTWRALFAYSHHGIYVGGSKVVHFTPGRDASSSSLASLSSSSNFVSPPCSTFPDCGYCRPNSGVVLSCLDCFLGQGSLYCFQYGVTSAVFLSKLRGGTCTTAPSDTPASVIHRAMYLLQNGFGKYHMYDNNCEDFALYCKTGLIAADPAGVGRSGQASSVFGAPVAAILSTPFKFLMASPAGLATATAGMYCMSRYATDIGVRTDVHKVAVEDLALKLGWAGDQNEQEDAGGSDGQIGTVSVVPLSRVES